MTNRILCRPLGTQEPFAGFSTQWTLGLWANQLFPKGCGLLFLEACNSGNQAQLFRPCSHVCTSLRPGYHRRPSTVCCAPES